MNKFEIHTCRDEDYFTRVPFKACLACICQLSINAGSKYKKRRK